MEKKLKYKVLAEDDSLQAGEILRRKLGLTDHQIRSAKYRPGGICLDGRQVRVSDRVREGEELQVLLELETDGSMQLEAVPGQVDILYEDEDILLVNKPAGLPVHPAHGHYRDTLANYLVWHYRQQGKQVGIRPVGRLDKDTSGIVLFAKNKVAAARLWAGKDCVQKEYLALVQGSPSPKRGCVECPIRKAAGELNRMEAAEDGTGSYARTHYQVLRNSAEYSLVSLKLDTGRTHQIRVHMAWLGHPLLGDPIYGEPILAEEEKETANDIKKIKRAALHCFRIRVIQPFTEEAIYAEAPLPEDMARLVHRILNN